MELSDEQVAEVMAASFPRERRVLMRMTVPRWNAEGDMEVTLDPGERIVGVVQGQHQPMVWITLGEDKEVEDLRRWKQEATASLLGWERLWDALGQPGPLGGVKSDNVLEALRGDGVIE